MLNDNLTLLLAIAAGVLCVLGLQGLSHPKTARRGNACAMAGMALAVGLALLHPTMQAYGWVLAGLAAGAAVGIPLARKTPLTSLPQLVAVFHSLVGLAAALVALGMYLQKLAFGLMEPKLAVEMGLGAAIGLITLTGSILAALKLQGVVSGKPWGWWGRHYLNLGLGVGIVLSIGWFVLTFSPIALALIFAMSLILGWTLVAPIGGADMPVVVSMLNSYSGWAAAATGFAVESPLLIMVGALVGVSGAILSYVMCHAMQRSFISVILGGFGNAEDTAASASATPAKAAALAGTEDVAYVLGEAERVIIVPGYGMAVAQAQHAVKALTAQLLARGVEVRFAIHPVAGRMPGHMNVLLAEADIPYDLVEELEDVNPRFTEADVALILGANDVVNPAAQTEKSSPIYGMPVLEAWHAKRVFVVKRSHRPGYAGIENPLFTLPNAALVLGDAKDVVEKIGTALKAG
ncbi:MAG: NAD(P)(+) transhydrogenase (Re/Si-specific) subunit beta [Alphaproteobacteria bacterium]|nr:NAD(P)(+) transhydrogenase (Re/Si-specific) subunit beta [Alphaproteobacteria bacterium]